MEGPYDLSCGRVVSTDDDPVRVEPVLDGVSFSEKLRVRHVSARLQRGRATLDDAHSRARGDGAFHDDEAVAIAPGRPIERGADLTQVGGAGHRRRSPGGDQHHVTQALRDVLVVQEPELGPAACLVDELVETGFEDGRLAALERTDPLSVDVHPQHVVARFRQAGGGHLANRPQTYDGDFQYNGLSSFFSSVGLSHRVYHLARVRRGCAAKNEVSCSPR